MGDKVSFPFMYLHIVQGDSLLKRNKAKGGGGTSAVGHLSMQEAPRVPTPALELYECHWMFLLPS